MIDFHFLPFNDTGSIKKQNKWINKSFWCFCNVYLGGERTTHPDRNRCSKVHHLITIIMPLASPPVWWIFLFSFYEQGARILRLPVFENARKSPCPRLSNESVDVTAVHGNRRVSSKYGGATPNLGTEAPPRTCSNNEHNFQVDLRGGGFIVGTKGSLAMTQI